MEPVYLIYQYKGRIKVRKGCFDVSGNFRPDDKPNTWLSWGGRCCPKYLEFRLGKTWCFRKDIPKAIAMLISRQSRYRKDICEKADQFLKQRKGGLSMYIVKTDSVTGSVTCRFNRYTDMVEFVNTITDCVDGFEEGETEIIIRKEKEENPTGGNP